jgi:hypothetical protein
MKPMKNEDDDDDWGGRSALEGRWLKTPKEYRRLNARKMKTDLERMIAPNTFDLEAFMNDNSCRRRVFGFGISIIFQRLIVQIAIAMMASIDAGVSEQFREM